MLRKKIMIVNMITWCLLLLATIILNIFMVTSNYEVNRINTRQKIVMLTFDDGPTIDDEKILDILKQENIKATFFQTGKNIARYDSEPAIKHVLDRIINEGHAIGNHSYFHQKYMTKQEILINELQATNNLIKKVYKGNNISISDINIPIRMPYLQYYRGLDYVQKKLNIPYWVRGYLGTDYDEEKTGKDLILKQYKSHLKPGIIFVAHTRAYAQRWLKELIVWLKQQGYQFASFNKNSASYYENYGNLVN